MVVPPVVVTGEEGVTAEENAHALTQELVQARVARCALPQPQA